LPDANRPRGGTSTLWSSFATEPYGLSTGQTRTRIKIRDSQPHCHFQPINFCRVILNSAWAR
jgi:hypothetical protein